MLSTSARLAIACLAISMTAACGGSEPSPGALTPGDQTEIRRLDSVFVQAWLRDDTTAALSVFAPDAILLPPNSQPVTGLAAIRAYWWPTDGSKTVITKFTREIDEISGTRNLAIVRGRSELGWTYTRDGKSSSQTGRSASIAVLRRDTTGAWAVTRQIWNSTP